MPAHCFAILTTFENPNATTRVIFPALLNSPIPVACKVPDVKSRRPLSSSSMAHRCSRSLRTSNQVASPEPRQVADVKRTSDQVASPEPRQIERQTDEVFANQSLPLIVDPAGSWLRAVLDIQRSTFSNKKFKFKDLHTSWYTYSTPFPIEYPPELPHNATGLQDNVIFLHINEAQRAKYPHGQLSKLLKHCICMWIWNGGSSKWEKISIGERRIIKGYELCLSLNYQKNIYLQWATPKAFKAIITENC
ncbi:hypothetical protein EV360DRAFT_77116 [Lentinula raphanica]|nr:hypothetical protein EV360DRAFT_77116 [Lentinula raphanica]